MIKNKKELIKFIKKVKHPGVEPCSTVIKGCVAWYGGVGMFYAPAIMCNFDDEDEVKSILREVKEEMGEVKTGV